MAIITEEIIPFDAFREIILETLKEHLGPEKEVSTNMVLKNNGLSLEGIMIKNTKSGISPTFYLETLYDMYKDGMPLDKIVDEILPFYEKEYTNDYFDTNIFGKLSDVKENLFVKLINTDRNLKLLEKIPSVSFLDLSAVVYLTIADINGAVGSVVVTKDLLKTWKKDFDAIYEIAKKNTYEKLQVEITSMSKFILSMMDDPNLQVDRDEFRELTDELNHEDNEELLPMYIMTNNRRHLGASCLLFDDVKQFAASINSDLYIIPSSIHEILLVPVKDEFDYERLLEVHTAVNTTELSSSEYLSGNVYYYSNVTKEIML